MCHKIHRQVKLLKRLTTRVEFCVIISGSNNSYAWFSWRLDPNDDVVSKFPIAWLYRWRYLSEGWPLNYPTQWFSKTHNQNTSIRIEDEMKWRARHSESHGFLRSMPTYELTTLARKIFRLVQWPQSPRTNLEIGTSSVAHQGRPRIPASQWQVNKSSDVYRDPSRCCQGPQRMLLREMTWRNWIGCTGKSTHFKSLSFPTHLCSQAHSWAYGPSIWCYHILELNANWMELHSLHRKIWWGTPLYTPKCKLTNSLKIERIIWKPCSCVYPTAMWILT